MASNDYFQFKQFIIRQSGCAMKVCTDSVLLGAYAQPANVDKIIDIGTGSGLLAVMMALKCPNASIDAIDIDPGAIQQARANFKENGLNGRINAYEADFREFTAQDGYDYAICNPPYFEDGVPTSSDQRNKARYRGSLDIAELMRGISNVLKNNGKAALCLPYADFCKYMEAADKFCMHAEKIISVRPTPKKNFYLNIVILAKTPISVPIEEKQLCIRDENNGYSEEYIQITREYYLRF